MWKHLEMNFNINVTYLPRQQVVFWKECRKNKGFGSLRKDFYTRFKPEVKWELRYDSKKERVEKYEGKENRKRQDS